MPRVRGTCPQRRLRRGQLWAVLRSLGRAVGAPRRARASCGHDRPHDIQSVGVQGRPFEFIRWPGVTLERGGIARSALGTSSGGTIRVREGLPTVEAPPATEARRLRETEDVGFWRALARWCWCQWVTTRAPSAVPAQQWAPKQGFVARCGSAAEASSSPRRGWPNSKGDCS
jgi:hypothetical protein